jgi:phosphoribosylanthranilate isomerase
VAADSCDKIGRMQARVKICGITQAEDAVVAAEAGADAIGLVFYDPSPRAVTIAQAQQVVQALPPFVTTVGLFVNAERERIEAVLQQVSLDLLQFHGAETPAFCEAFQRPWMKAIRMKPDVDLQQEAERYSHAAALLVDAYQAGVPGGTGETFDWARIPSQLSKPLVLAGGLTVDNVQQAVTQVKPWAVDVSGGVEQSKGFKSHSKVAQFIENAKRVPFE